MQCDDQGPELAANAGQLAFEVTAAARPYFRGSILQRITIQCV
jgi:hypothetical protein